ncbi:MAG: beta-ketoacyl-ACP synthase 3, partial [Firmicutes bacterium]|nr:beta-ketoacyl-ACP synthase 3 [Bacillota bacterium]
MRRLDGKRPGILGVGSAVPSQVLSNQDLERMVDTSDQWILERSGIRERRIAPPGVCTSDLAAEAAVAALADAGTQPSEIDLVIVATVTPDTIFPATSCLVQHRLGMMNAAAFDLSVGCTGFIYGLSTASQFVANGTCRKVLVIGADLLSRITDWEDRNTCVLFGDGAGAVVVGETENGNGILSFVLGTDGSGAVLLKMPAGGSRQPASHDTVD